MSELQEKKSISKEELIENVTGVINDVPSEIRGFIFIGVTDDKVASGIQGYSSAIGQGIAEFLAQNDKYIPIVEEAIRQIKVKKNFGDDPLKEDLINQLNEIFNFNSKK